MTQDEYKLFTGADASAYSATDWNRLVAVAKSRLASFLCLPDGFPEQPADDLLMLLANFIAATIKHAQGNEKVESKHIRNFTINFKTTTAADAFAEIADEYGDIIDAYSNCDKGFIVEGSARYCCGRF